MWGLHIHTEKVERFCFRSDTQLSNSYIPLYNMTTNVLPLFWNLASSSKDTRLTASASLVSSLETFQSVHQPRPAVNGDEASSEDEEDDDESGIEVDDDDGDMSEGERKEG
jgi:hypothetical protein